MEAMLFCVCIWVLQDYVLIFKLDSIWELGLALMQFALVLSLTVANKKCWPKSASWRIIDLLIADNQVPAHAETTFVSCHSARIWAASPSPWCNQQSGLGALTLFILRGDKVVGIQAWWMRSWYHWPFWLKWAVEVRAGGLSWGKGCSESCAGTALQCSPWLVQCWAVSVDISLLKLFWKYVVVGSYFFFNVLPLLLCSAREGVSVCCRLCRMFKMKQGLMKICVPQHSQERRGQEAAALLWLLPSILAPGHGRLFMDALCSLHVHLSQPPFAHQAFSIPWLDQVSLKDVKRGDNGWWAFLMTLCRTAVDPRPWENRRKVRASLRKIPLADGHYPCVGAGPLGQGEQGKSSETPCLADEELEHIALAEAFWWNNEFFMVSIWLGADAVCRAVCASEVEKQVCFPQCSLQGFAAGMVLSWQSPAALGPAPCSGAVCSRVWPGRGNAVEWLGVHRGRWQCPGVRSRGDTEQVVPAWVTAGAGVSPAATLKPHQRNRWSLDGLGYIISFGFNVRPPWAPSSASSQSGS